MQPHIRWMIRRDMVDVLSIEAECYDAASAWQEEDFLRALRRRNCIGMVAEVNVPKRDCQVVGFMVYSLEKTSIYLDNLAVHPRCRRDGVGRAMLAKVQAKLTSFHRNKIVACVRETNLAAQLFFRACGYQADKVLPAYFTDDDDHQEAAFRFVRYAEAAALLD